MYFCVKTPISKLYVFGLALLLAVTLAGCSGSDSKGGAVDPMDTGPDPALQMAADVAQAAADAADAAAAAAEMAAANTSKHDAASMDKANADTAALAARTAATEARAAALAAQVAADNGDLATAHVEQGKAEAARMTAETEQGNAETAMADAAMAVADAIEAVMQMAVTEAAKTKAEAINAEAMGSDTAPFDSETVAENYTVTAEHTDGAVAVNIAIPGAAMDAPAFMRVDALPPMEGWNGGMNTLGPNDDGETEIVGVYTDITPPKPTAFATVYELDVSTDTGNDTPQATNEALAINQGDLAVVGRVKSDSFTANGAAVLTYAMDDSSTPDVDEAFEAEGFYADAPGTYKCSGGANCTVTLDANGKITAISNGWIFTPAAGATVDVPDADYLYYGFWVKKTDKDGATTYNEVQTFAGAMGISEFNRTHMLEVRGTANYVGGAAGVYMRKTFATDGKIVLATSGTFTADVSLMANFGGDDVPANEHYSIEGSISNFALSGGEENAWGVNLKAGFGKTDNAFSGTANGGGAEAVWNGIFYGGGGNTPEPGDGTAKVSPESVAGEFNAHFTNGHVAGGYGAHR